MSLGSGLVISPVEEPHQQTTGHDTMMNFLTSAFILIVGNILIVVFGVFADLYDWSRWGNVPSFKTSMEPAEIVAKLISVPMIHVLNGTMTVVAFIYANWRVALVIAALGIFILGALVGNILSAS